MIYRGIVFSVRDAYAGFPGFYYAVVGSFDGGDRRIIEVETFGELTDAIDAYLAT